MLGQIGLSLLFTHSGVKLANCFRIEHVIQFLLFFLAFQFYFSSYGRAIRHVIASVQIICVSLCQTYGIIIKR
jgi:hypothetical protein